MISRILSRLGTFALQKYTGLKQSLNPSVDASAEYSKALSELTEDEDRNRLIAQTVAENNGHGISLILSDRKAHCDTLQDILSDAHGTHSPKY